MKCNAYGGTFKLPHHAQRFDVHCVLEKGHKGKKHVAAVMGYIQRWEGDFSKAPASAIRLCPKGHQAMLSQGCLGCQLEEMMRRPIDITDDVKRELQGNGVIERVRTGAASNHPANKPPKLGFWQKTKNFFSSLFIDRSAD